MSTCKGEQLLEHRDNLGQMLLLAAVTDIGDNVNELHVFNHLALTAPKKTYLKLTEYAQPLQYLV